MRLLLLFCMALALLPAKAQLFLGVEAGITRNRLNLPISATSYTKNDARNGIAASLRLEVMINNWISILADPGLIRKNNALVRTGPYQGIVEDFDNSYWQLPVRARFSFRRKKGALYATAGMYAGYWAFSKVNGSIPDILDVTNTATGETFAVKSYRGNYTFSSRDRRFEFGWKAGIGYQHRLRKGFSVFAEINDEQAITSRKKGLILESYPYNQTLVLSVGLTHLLWKFR